MPADRRLARLDLPAEEVVALDRLTKLEQVLLVIVPFERARDHPLVGTAAPVAQRRQPSRVALARQDRTHDRHPRHSGDVAHYIRSEEPTSELPSLMSNSYAVF